MGRKRLYKINCENCGEILKIKSNGTYARRFCSLKCCHEYCVGDKSWNFRNGIVDGEYTRILVNGKYLREHRYLMEKMLGRKLLKCEYVHHIDGNTKNNNISNLVLMKDGQHTILHIKGKPNLGSRKHKVVAKIPEPLIIGEIISVLPKYQYLITIKCAWCGKLNWSRYDYAKNKKEITCGSSCYNSLRRQRNGIPKNKRYHYRDDM